MKPKVSEELEGQMSIADYEGVIPESVKQENITQMDLLPGLKNNEQWKAFLENYRNWTLWLDIPETGEKYYRFVLEDKVAVVVRTSRRHTYRGGRETKTCEYGAEQYYLTGVKITWRAKGMQYVRDSSRTFYECATNKSAVIEFLKKYQKQELISRSGKD